MVVIIKVLLLMLRHKQLTIDQRGIWKADSTFIHSGICILRLLLLLKQLSTMSDLDLSNRSVNFWVASSHWNPYRSHMMVVIGSIAALNSIFIIICVSLLSHAMRSGRTFLILSIRILISSSTTKMIPSTTLATVSSPSTRRSFD